MKTKKDQLVIYSADKLFTDISKNTKKRDKSPQDSNWHTGIKKPL